MPVDGRSRKWCVTVNNYTPDMLKSIDEYSTSDNVIYMIVGKETAETTGTPHLQCFMHVKNKMSMKQLKNIYGNTAHVEIAKGNDEQNQAYCSKQEVYLEVGKPAINGKRKSLELLKEKLLSKTPVSKQQLYIEYPQYVRLIDKMLEYESGRVDKPTVIWIYGKSGSGKSRYAHKLIDESEHNTVYKKTGNNKWFNGYDNHEILLIDDIRSKSLDYNELLQLLDRYGYRVETKGGMRQLTAKLIIITSNKSPDSLFDYMDEDNAQLLRRIDNLIHMEYQKMTSYNSYNVHDDKWEQKSVDSNPFDDILDGYTQRKHKYKLTKQQFNNMKNNKLIEPTVDYNQYLDM